MPRYKIIVNPTSGRGMGEQSYPIIDHELKKLGLDYEMCRTEAPGHAIQLAKQAAGDGYDVVVAAGGDGTLNEVLNGLMCASSSREARPALGVIPIGRGNDFCFGVDIPSDIEVVCQLLAGGECRPIDVGFVRGGDYPEGRYFGNGVGIGFDAVVGFEALKLKKLGGFPSYIVAALKTILLYYQAPTVKIEMNGTAYTQPALMVSIMNGRRMGGGFMMAPDGSMDDGLFDLVVAGQVSRPGILALLPRFMMGTQAGHPAITTDRMDGIKVTAIDGTLPAHADGETLSTSGQELDIIILPKALQVIGSDHEGEL
jgi:YegS/Rv2252/BmrU family lipid kinase